MIHRTSRPRFRWLRAACAPLLALVTLLAAATPLAPSAPAPDFTLRTLDGQKLRLGEQRGRVVLVNFWATWCGPCRQEMPHLNKLYEKYKAKGVIVLGVMTDNPGESDLLNFQSDYEMSYPVVRGNSDIITAFNYPQALPTTFVFDKGGHRVGRATVGAIRPETLSAQLDELVAQN